MLASNLQLLFVRSRRSWVSDKIIRFGCTGLSKAYSGFGFRSRSREVVMKKLLIVEAIALVFILTSIVVMAQQIP